MPLNRFGFEIPVVPKVHNNSLEILETLVTFIFKYRPLGV